MDCEEAVRLLKGGEEGIAEWNARREDGEEIPTLENANFFRTDLSGADLNGADLSGATLVFADLHETRLIRASLQGVYLSDANLEKANLHEAGLCSADLSSAKLEGTNLYGANLRKADLSGADLQRADLQGADLRNATLNGADLRRANLSGASLRRADLSNADLRNAKLRRANLSTTILGCANLENADLRRANLHETNLSGAKLDRPDLRGVTFIRANLRGADLSCAKCGLTSFSNVDLSLTKRLETVKHYFPSDIGLNTLYKSQGKIPGVFLRGCGVPENLIASLPSLMEQTIQYYSCFISYSHQDKSFARRLHDTLQGRDIRCWLDEHEILPGDNVYAAVDRGIDSRDKVLLCASKHSLTSGWVDDEIKHAFAKEKQLFHERGEEVLVLIPLNLDGYIFDGWQHPKKNLVLERLAADFRGWEHDNPKFEYQVERVIKALALTREPAPGSKL